MSTWEKPADWANNVILEGKGFFISYNPQAGAPIHSGDPVRDSLGVLVQTIGGLFVGEERPQEETALHSRARNGKWYILRGDFRKEYEAAVPKGFKACLAVYTKHKAKNGSNWSTGK